MGELPSIIPVFPLPNVVLFPQVMLPLHIFESRYRQMVRDAQTQSPALIGMALLRGNWQENYEGNPDIFPVGCVGEMMRVAPLPDGRFNILLQGVRVYRITEEVSTKSYREARVDWQPSVKESLSPELRRDLRYVLERYLRNNENVQQLLADPAVEDDFLVNFFSFHLDFMPIEKQGLLEALTLRERAERLQDMLDFKLSEPRGGDGGSGGQKTRLH
ncbi:MAG: LON peptidase substrate-binding domain-containing protein [Candidatus Binatia bacterium]